MQAERDEGRRRGGLATEERQALQTLRRENQGPPRGAGDLKEGRGLVRSGDRLDPAEAFEFVRVHRASHTIAARCRVLEVTASGYYEWSTRPASARAKADPALLDRIREMDERSRGTYGVPRIHAELAAPGIPVGRKHVARLMCESRHLI